MSGGSGSSGSSGGSAGYDSFGNVSSNNNFGFSGFSEKAGVTSFSADPGLSSFGEGGYSGYKGRAVYGDKAKNTTQITIGSILSAIGFAVPGAGGFAVIGGKQVYSALEAKPAIDEALDAYKSEYPAMAAQIEEARTTAQSEALASFSMGTSTGNGEGASPAEQQTSSAKTAAAAAKAASDTAARDKAKAASDKAAATAKAVADKAKADEEAKTKATLLAKRRQASQSYYTSGGAQGLLGQAPVQLKTLLGE